MNSGRTLERRFRLQVTNQCILNLGAEIANDVNLLVWLAVSSKEEIHLGRIRPNVVGANCDLYLVCFPWKIVMAKIRLLVFPCQNTLIV